MEGERKPNDKTCKGGCGFFGSAATNGLCSLCYKKQLTKMNAAHPQTPQAAALEESAMASTSIAPPPPTPALVDDAGPSNSGGGGVKAEVDKPEVETKSEATSDVEDVVGENGSPAKKAKRNRCATCRKKVGLLGFECRCGGVFCGIHRYSDKHDCTFDYREHGKTEIEKNNPVVVAEKIKKI